MNRVKKISVRYAIEQACSKIVAHDDAFDASGNLLAGCHLAEWQDKAGEKRSGYVSSSLLLDGWTYNDGYYAKVFAVPQVGEAMTGTDGYPDAPSVVGVISDDLIDLIKQVADDIEKTEELAKALNQGLYLLYSGKLQPKPLSKRGMAEAARAAAAKAELARRDEAMRIISQEAIADIQAGRTSPYMQACAEGRVSQYIDGWLSEHPQA